MKTLRKSTTYALLTLLWIGVIFSFSLIGGEASSAQSGVVAQAVLFIFKSVGLPTEGYNLVFWVRKLAHFSEYFILGCLLTRSAQTLKREALYLYIFLVPVIDETLQYFTPGRVMSPIDMAIDACGILAGILVIRQAMNLIRKR